MAVVTHAARAPGLPDAGLFRGAADGASGGGIELARQSRPQPRRLMAAQGRQDASAGTVPGLHGSVAQADKPGF